MLERGRGTLGPSDLVGRADESNRVYFVALPNDCHDQEEGEKVGIVAKKWEPGNLVPSRFSGQIRKVEARLGKLAKIRKVETN